LVSALKLVVVADNEASPPLVPTWGLSIYLETPSWNAYWDADSRPEVVRHNAEALGVPLKSKYLIFSHRHWDHTGGASAIEAERVVAPADPRFPLPAAKVRGPTKLDEGLYLSRTLVGDGIPERALVVDVEGFGQVMLVGCSHPGVDKLYESVIGDFGFRPRVIVGGFHLAGAPRKAVEAVISRLYELGAEELHPIHCSGNYARALARSNVKAGTVMLFGKV